MRLRIDRGIGGIFGLIRGGSGLVRIGCRLRIGGFGSRPTAARAGAFLLRVAFSLFVDIARRLRFPGVRIAGIGGRYNRAARARTPSVGIRPVDLPPIGSPVIGALAIGIQPIGIPAIDGRAFGMRSIFLTHGRFRRFVLAVHLISIFLTVALFITFNFLFIFPVFWNTSLFFIF